MLIERSRLGAVDIRLPADAGEVLRFAAAELGAYLGAMSGKAPAVRPDPTLTGARLHFGAAPAAEAPAGGDAFVVAPGESGVAIAGACERAVLHGAYRLLESLGCRWSFHGRTHESIPALPASGTRVSEIVHRPRYRVRAYATDIHTWHYHQPEHFNTRLPDDTAFADWMAKTGGNGFFFIRHPFDTQMTVPELLPEFRRRGIVPEYGGHVIPVLLPREWFARHPEFFPVAPDGERRDFGNLCAGNEDALRLVAEHAVACVREFPEIGALHIWGADLWAGGWCHCAACRSVSVQDQSLRVCNAAAAALRAAGHDVPVCYLAYHDTIEPDLTLRPDPGVVVEFAPRERCYGHALDDPECETNPRYRRAFERYMELFDGRGRVFEYYGDSILFCGCAVPLVEVVQRDLDYYHRAGACEMTFLQFGTYSLWAHPLNFLAFAAAARGDACEPMLAAHFDRCGDHHAARAYFAAIEDAMRQVVTYGDVRRPPRRRAPDILPRLGSALPVLAEWRERLAVNDRMEQVPLLAYTHKLLEGAVAYLGDSPRARQEAESLWAEAVDIVQRAGRAHIGVWGAVDLPVIHGYFSANPAED